MSQPNQLPVAVLLDANIWHNDPLLKGPEGAALLYHLTSQGNLLALPEVAERENKKNLQERAKEYESWIDEGWRFLERINGNRPEDRIPREEELLLKMTQRLDELKACIVKVPLREEHLRKALDRVIEGSPPNGPEKRAIQGFVNLGGITGAGGKIPCEVCDQRLAFL